MQTPPSGPLPIVPQREEEGSSEDELEEEDDDEDEDRTESPMSEKYEEIIKEYDKFVLF